MIDKLFTLKGEGPILITAPHTIKTIRKSKYIHKKETYINNIIHNIYNKLGPKMCTLLTWNIDYIKKYGLFPTDPNHISINKSIWFKQLKELKSKRKYYFHLDLHGMKNSSSKNDIEIGMKAIRLYHKGISQHMKKYIKIYFKKLYKSFGFHSIYQGWGKTTYNAKKFTITRQAILLGFFSLQLELSFDYRKELYENKESLNNLVKTIKKIYNNLKETIRKRRKIKTTHKAIKKRINRYKTRKLSRHNNSLNKFR